MKSLDLNQMEKIDGGNCSAGANITAALSLYYAVALASGPVGWGLAGLALAGAYYQSTSCA